MTNTSTLHTPFKTPLPQKTGQRLSWGRLHGASIALAVANALAEYDGLGIVITPDMLTAQKLGEDLRFFAGSECTPLSFPDWETLPYDMFSPHQDIISERLGTLYHLPLTRRGVLLLPITTFMQRLAPSDYVQLNSLVLSQGEQFDREVFCRRLELSGYRHVSQVMEHGEYSVRGSLLDLFPMGSPYPYRIDLFDDEVDSIRFFDPETQRSQDKVEDIQLLPAREFPLTAEAIQQFREHWHARFGNQRGPAYEDICRGMATPGAEYYLPLFFEHTSTLFDYLPERCMVFMLPDTAQRAESFWHEVAGRYEQLRHDVDRPILPPDELYLHTNETLERLREYSQVRINHADGDDHGRIFACQPPPTLPIDARNAHPLKALETFLSDFEGRVLLTAETTGRRENLLELLKTSNLTPRVYQSWADFLDDDGLLGITVAPLEQGLLLEQPEIAVISETQLFGERVAQRRRRTTTERDTDAIVRNLTELSMGSPVVHEMHGVGRYMGLTTLTFDDRPAEFLTLEYAGGDKLYVPVSALDVISRYTGAEPDSAPLHKLGTDQWDKAKKKAAARARDVAAELLELHARRAAREGEVFEIDELDYQRFVQGFPYEETPDQEAAIIAVREDMHAAKPMDRLVCGDVGFGKTEVAMRAAFIAVQNSKQVAVLVPTTLLSQQHFENFRDRFADWPVRVGQLSRFGSSKEQKETLAALESGKIDIVIGTHRLLQKNIKFKNLGLLIIDEEHRFGVRQKEQFKAMRAEVDILTLTATPIPRSLNMALSDLRDLSIIATPPSKRLAIKTFVSEWKDPLISEAITRELKRGGQVYFLHNAVQTIERTAQKIAELVPEARVNVGHGQMPERELERVMQDFYHRRFNVLVSTTIIESGIDIPTANTIIIDRADKLGLAQLYQLRGRVGRSSHRAYAYLLTPPKGVMTQDAVKRLDAIAGLEELGVGFTLATHDLEIRGAGEFLGEEQSGHLQQIGFTLYTELLSRAVDALKSGRQPELERPLEQGSEIDMQVAALLPEDYMPDVHTRLITYKRIAGASDQEALDDLYAELIDRFGLLPEPAKNLFHLTSLKLKTTPLGMRKIDMGESGGRVVFIDKPPIDPMKIVDLARTYPGRYKPGSDNSLRIEMSMKNLDARVRAVEYLVEYLG